MTELHDDVVLTEAEFRRLAGNMSRSTVRRLDQRGEAPPKVRRLIERQTGSLPAGRAPGPREMAAPMTDPTRAS